MNITFQGVKDTENTVKMSYVILATYPWAEVEEVDETKPVGYREVSVTPYTGYKVVTYKHIYDADGKELSKTQEATSNYDKRDKKYIVGPAETQLPDYDPDDDPLWPDDPTDPDDPFNPFDPVEPEDPGTDEPDTPFDPGELLPPET